MVILFLRKCPRLEIISRLNSQLLKHLPKSILYDGTQTSMNVFSASSIKQWYWNFAGSLQF